MQIILQQILEYWPVLAALSPALRHELQCGLMQPAPAILAVGTAIVAGAIVVAAKVRAITFLPMLLFALLPFLLRLESGNWDPNSAELQYGELFAIWKNSLLWGCLMAGAMVGAIGLAKS
jgi:di/tricarboxylate transporter